MASVEKQLLGTETVVALRAKNVHCRICGLSANDLATTFLNAGADFFLLKPIPVDKDSLKRELRRITLGERNWKPPTSDVASDASTDSSTGRTSETSGNDAGKGQTGSMGLLLE